MSRGGILLRIEQRNSKVVPPHPFLVFGWIRRDGFVLPRLNRAALRGHVNDCLVVVLAHAEINKMLIEPAIFDGRRDRDRANRSERHNEGVAHQLGTSGLDGVVIGYDAVSPNLMQLVEATIDI